MKEHDILLIVLVLSLAGVGWSTQSELQQVQDENDQLREKLSERAVCSETRVQVVCGCPCLEEVEAQSTCIDDLSFEELKTLCDEIEAYGYVPRC